MEAKKNAITKASGIEEVFNYCYTDKFEMEDVELTITQDAYIAIAKKAIERKTGARGLRAILEENLLIQLERVTNIQMI